MSEEYRKGEEEKEKQKEWTKIKGKKIQVALKSISFFSLVNEDGYSI